MKAVSYLLLIDHTMHSKDPHRCYSVDLSKIKWDISEFPPKKEVIAPVKHVYALDLRTRIRDDNGMLPKNSAKVFDFGLNLIEVELEPQVHDPSNQNSPSKSSALVERKRESADSITPQLQYSKLGESHPSAAASPSSLLSLYQKSMKPARNYPAVKIPAHFKCSRSKREEASLHGKLKLSEACSQISKKKKRKQKLRRDLKLSECLIPEKVSGIVKLKCHDTREAFQTPGHSSVTL